MRRASEIAHWVKAHPLQPAHVDCATAVMLKILDGKCKMNPEEKRIMAWLYQAVKQQPGELLGKDIHRLIAASEQNIDDSVRDAIYERRVLAETMITRPVMKAFKTMIRQQGLFAEADARSVDEEQSVA